MTHSEGLQVLLRDLDARIADARAMIADTKWLNQEAPEFKKAKEAVNAAITAVFLYKNCCDDVEKAARNQS